MNFHCRLFNISKIFYYGRNNIQTKLYPLSVISNQSNHISTNTSLCLAQTKNNNEGFFKTLMSKIPFLDITKSKLKVSGYFLYESVADKISYAEFFQLFSLPDSFYSWFLVTELHVWMLLVRTMAEGEDGRYTRNKIVQAMWTDVNTRAKKLGAANPSGIQMQIEELSQQFQAALIAYDEGLLSDDKVLANALWRRFFQQECDSAQLETLLHYVRKQIRLLDDLTTDELLHKNLITWTSLKNV